MFKKSSLFVLVLVLIALTPLVEANFSNPPTFDLTTSSNTAGATTAVYSIFLQNPDPAEDANNVSIAIPAGYSVGPQFITSTVGIPVGSVSGACPMGSGGGSVVTTSTPGQFAMVVMGMTIGQIIITQPTATTQGKMGFLFRGRYGFDDHGCHGNFMMLAGFFINPSTSGTYSWAPSSAIPTTGSPVVMAPRPGYSQNVTIAA